MLDGHYNRKGDPCFEIHLPSFIVCFSSLWVSTRKERTQRDCLLEQEPTGGLQRALARYIREQIMLQGVVAASDEIFSFLVTLGQKPGVTLLITQLLTILCLLLQRTASAAQLLPLSRFKNELLKYLNDEVLFLKYCFLCSVAELVLTPIH